MSVEADANKVRGGERKRGQTRGNMFTGGCARFLGQTCAAGRTSTGSRCSLCSGLPVRLGQTIGTRSAVLSGPNVWPRRPSLSGAVGLGDETASEAPYP